MPALSQCPDPVRWGDLLDNRLPEPVASSLSSHLEGCPDCQSTLESLTAGESTWAEAASVLEQRPRPELRRAMEQLKAEGETGLDTVAPTAAGSQTLPFLRPSADPEHLGRLGPYEVLGVIGRGGMGVVLKAFDPALRRMVAIKVLAPQWAAHAEARKRFEREARAAALVRHENVVAIHAVEEADGLPYLVMEFVPGGSLQRLLDGSGPLPLKDILYIGAQVAAGLAAAHAQDLIHRDVKPANILLDAAGNVRLTDFGLARAVDDTSLTQTGVIAGTPQYMAPEQARGARLDHRADLFSLGSVLYAMCTGRPPFRAPTTMAVLRRVCDDEPRDVRDYNRNAPGWLVEIIDKLHAKKPRDRFRSADQVSRLLSWHLAHLRSPDTVEKPGPVGRHRTRGSRLWWVAATAVLAAPILALVVWGAVYALTPRHDPDPAPVQGQVQAQAQGEAPRPPAPRVQKPPVEVPKVKGDAFFQEVWADLHNDNPFTRKTACERLAGMKPNGEQAVVAKKLVELIEVEDWLVRRPAVRALGTWGTDKDVPVLLRALADKDLWTRKEALKVIGRFNDARTLEAVIVSFRDQSTREDAAQALREMRPMSEDAVAALLNEPDGPGGPWVRAEAAKLLAEIGTEKSLPALIKVLGRKEDHGARNEVLKFIAKYKDPRTVAPVVQNLREFFTRGEARDAIRKLGPMAEPEVLAILNEPDDLGHVSVKLDAVEVLADIGTEASVPALEKMKALAEKNIHYRRVGEPTQKALDAIAKRKKP
jgi:HEAT repeat protein